MNATSTINHVSAADARKERASGAFNLSDARTSLIKASKAFDRAEEYGVHQHVSAAINAVDDAMAAAAKREGDLATTAERVAFERHLEKGE